MRSLNLPPFRLIHAAYVTSDLQRGKRALAAMYGVEEVRVYPTGPVEVPGGVAMLDVAIAQCDGAAFEVIQPVGGKDDVYRQALSDNPDDIVFHHFASRILDQREWDMVKTAIADHDLEILVHGNYDDYKYVYIDTRRHLGHILEYIWFVTRQSEELIDTMGHYERVSA